MPAATALHCEAFFAIEQIIRYIRYQ